MKTEIVRSIELGAKIELDLSNYAKKTDLKNATGVDTSDSARIMI